MVKSGAMASPPTQRNWSRLAPVTVAVALVALLVALSAPATVRADSIASKRAQASAAEGELNRLYSKEDHRVDHISEVAQTATARIYID